MDENKNNEFDWELLIDLTKAALTGVASQLTPFPQSLGQDTTWETWELDKAANLAYELAWRTQKLIEDTVLV